MKIGGKDSFIESRITVSAIYDDMLTCFVLPPSRPKLAQRIAATTPMGLLTAQLRSLEYVHEYQFRPSELLATTLPGDIVDGLDRTYGMSAYVLLCTENDVYIPLLTHEAVGTGYELATYSMRRHLVKAIPVPISIEKFLWQPLQVGVNTFVCFVRVGNEPHPRLITFRVLDNRPELEWQTDDVEVAIADQIDVEKLDRFYVSYPNLSLLCAVRSKSNSLLFQIDKNGNVKTLTLRTGYLERLSTGGRFLSTTTLGNAREHMIYEIDSERLEIVEKCKVMGRAQTGNWTQDDQLYLTFYETFPARSSALIYSMLDGKLLRRVAVRSDTYKPPVITEIVIKNLGED